MQEMVQKKKKETRSFLQSFNTNNALDEQKGQEVLIDLLVGAVINRYR